ncbi:MAG TPA: peptide chain release factor N(5)-glutamine methyltransferase [Prevotella sp.]|nr:peptide chain release factor N(5)-glutamine methyltransferase [Prevotella sp.]
MTYQQLWKRLTSLYTVDEAQAIIRTVLDIRYGMSLTDIAIGKVNELSAEEKDQLEKIVRRLETGEPVQYILGETVFNGRTFHVEQGVLIPRPETAELLQYIPSYPTLQQTTEGEIKTPKTNIRHFLDIGTGSGCIAISAALEHPEAEVSAWDISEEALKTARNNAQQLGAKINFKCQDALQAPSGDTELWDVIISNPPYIMQKEQKDMEKNVLNYEPSIALFVPDDDPLCFYTAIAHYAHHALKQHGILLFEINPLCNKDMKDMLKQEGFLNTDFFPDTFGKLRFTKSIKR